jgi:hypothetical protein
MYEAPSHHSIHYYGKVEALGNAPSGRRHCNKKKGTEGHGCSRHACPKNLPRGQCHPQHPSMHMGNGSHCRNLSYVPTFFSCSCIEPLCPGCDHSMLCTNHPPSYLADPMIPNPVLLIAARKMMIPSSVFHTRMHLRASWGFCC